MVDLANYLYRALFLLALAVAPRTLSPDPATPKNLALALLVPLVVLGGVLVGATLLKKQLDSREGRIAAALIWVAVAVGLLGAVYFTGARAPLARGAAPVALFVWAALATTAAALAGEYLGSNWKHKRSAAAALVLAGGLLVHGDFAKNSGNTAYLWSTALDKDPANEDAFRNVTRTLLSQGKLDEVNKRAAACLRADPAACNCLVARGLARSSAAQKRRDPEKSRQAAAEVATTCPNVTAARAAHAEALVVAGKLDEAMAEADEALLLTDDPGRAHAAKAMVLLAVGKKDEAVDEARKAIALGPDRDASLLLVKVAINDGDLDGAEKRLLAMKALGEQDTDVLYDLALIADKRGRFNDARTGYLATLKIDPSYKDARRNVALLTWRKGVLDEARNHVEKFLKIAPDDPEGPALRQMIYSQPPPQGQ